MVLLVGALVMLLITITRGAGSRRLLWSDEFDGRAGAAVNPAVWTHETGTGWGDGQLQCYTAAAANSHLDGDGHLLIVARHSSHARCAPGESGEFTSARLRSRGDVTPGRIEVRAKLPTGVGLHPAIWAIGSDYPQVGWPNSGEIDLAEVRGEALWNGMHVHGPGYSGAAAPGVWVRVPDMGTQFHVYSATIHKDRIEFQVDGQPVWSFTGADVPVGQRWVFGKPLMMVLNVAVGGGFAGSPDPSTSWPQTMVVDYVRVYA